MSEPRVEIYEDAAGEWRWMLYAGNGEEMAMSTEGYDNKGNAKRAWITVEEYMISGSVNIVERPVSKENQ